ncbi:Sterol 3-beta-glucosyltransferase UGT80A2 [Lasiodiplodia theobromae]|uniref:Sterol 3-beta-glucosyltransferase UGT80A2 n=1 Tax=Lasiodiplodia theobromae TaxID=45133 RepID=A0A5N5CZQ3_9PEZI|nr:Sterol 3-beta-glucosyltransferase UGT80A2 [Lasiodiplodia theobromae]
MTEGPDLADTLKIPFTYCWSPALVSKPVDWPPHIDVCGFFFRSPPAYEPPADLVAFLQVGSRPVYIGFGSIVLEDPARMASTILQAVAASGCRAIVSKGWSGLSGVQDDKVYFVGDCPHEWLFQQVSAVVHHGGAGTTACGLRYGKPTAVIPFFGDQPFWGEMIAARGAGPRPIYHQYLTADNLAAAIRFCLTPEAGIAAAGIAESMGLEDGIRAAVDSFHRHLPISRLQCDILPDQPAVWSAKVGKSTVRLSKAAAEVVLSESVVKAKALRMHEINPIYIETRRWDPITGGSSAILGTTADLTKAFTGTFYKPIQEYAKYHEEKVETKDPAANKELDSNGEMIIDSKRSVESELSSSAAPDQKSRSLGTKMAASSAKSIGMFAPMAAKGMLVDIPLALTEGLRNLPRSFGDEVRDHEPITNWKSGAAVAGKTFVNGFAEGISDVVMKPYQGAVKEGSIGAVKGRGGSQKPEVVDA